MKFCKQGVCFQTAEIEPVPGTGRVEKVKSKNGEVLSLRYVQDYRPCDHGLCYYHRKLQLGLLEPSPFYERNWEWKRESLGFLKIRIIPKGAD